MNQRGFALVESLATMSFAAAALTGGAGLTYSAFAHMFLKRAAYEYAICLSSRDNQQTQVQCKQIFKTSVAQALPIGRLDHVTGMPTPSSVEVRAHFKAPGGIDISVEDIRQLPLLPVSTEDGLKRRFP